MTVGILGSGFGLYGYLPALTNLDESVNVLTKTKQIIESREDLRGLSERVSYFDTEFDLLESSKSIVFARTPSAQQKFIIQYAGKFEHFFLEKPLSPHIREDERLLEHLSKVNQSFSIGYIFLFTEWFAELELNFKNSSVSIIEIVWEQRFANDWKSDSNLGGGILKYYGIHFLSVIAKMRSSLLSATYQLSDSEFNINCISLAGTTLRLKLRAAKNSRFEITYDHAVSFEENSPFQNNMDLNGADLRVPFLERYIRENLSRESSCGLWLESSIQDLLRQIETGTKNPSTLKL